MNNRKKFSLRLKLLFSLILILSITLVTLLLFYFLQGDVKVINPNPYDVLNKNITKVDKENNSYILKVDDYYFNSSKKDSPLSFLSFYNSSIKSIQFNQGIKGDKDLDKEYTDITYEDIYANILDNKEVVLNIEVKRFFGRPRKLKIKFDFSDYTFAYLNGIIVEIENINAFPVGSQKRKEKGLDFASRILKKFPAFSWYKDKALKDIVNLNYYTRTNLDEKFKGFDIHSTQEKKRIDFVYDVLLDLGNPQANLTTSIPKQTKIKDGFLMQKPFQNPTLKGYKFAGWYDLNEEEFDFTKPITHDTVIFAKWNLISYQINYVNDGDNIENTSSYTIEDKDIVLKNGTKFGYTFNGWSEDNGATKVLDYTIKKGSIGNKNLKAFYTPNLYKIEYEYFNTNKNQLIKGQQNQEQEVVFDSKFSLNFKNINDYVFINYTYFDKNEVEKVLTSDYTTSIKYIWDHNLKIRINYSQNIFQLNFDSGKFATNNPDTVKLVEGSYVSEPKDPIRVGYTFKGWYDLPQEDGQEAKGYRLDFPYALIKNTTAYAKWEINNYEILFNPLGGKWPTNEDTIILRNESQEQVYPIYAKYNDIIQSSPTVKRFGYTFKGWFTSRNFEPESQIFTNQNGNNQHYKVYKNENVFAKWEPNLVNIEFHNTDPNNKNIISQLDSKYEETYQFPVPKEREDGYEFVGWTLSDNTEGKDLNDVKVFNVKDLTFTHTSNKPLKLYTFWAYHVYKISIDTRGGTPINNAEYNINENLILAKYNQTIKLPTTKPEDLKLTKKPGYTFAGWYLDDEKTPTKENNLIKNSFTILAKWNVIQDYKLKYNAVDVLNPDNELEGVNWQGKFEENQPKEEKYTVEDEKELPNVSKTGYKFLGWTVKQHPNNESQSKEDIQNIKNMVPHVGYTVYKGTYGTKEFTANFIPDTFNITYNFNNEQKIVIAAKVRYNDKFNLIIPERVGYKFKGWKYNNDLYDQQPQPDGSFTYTYTFDITLNAQWEKITFDVVYLDNNDIQVYTEKYPYGTVLNTTEAEKEGNGYKPGFSIIDWKLHNGKDIIKPYRIYENTVLKAQYKERLYTLTYNEGTLTPKEQYRYYQNITPRKPKETDSNIGKKFLGYFFTNKNGQEEKLSSNYAYDFDIIATPKFDAQYFTVIVDPIGGDNVRFKNNALPIENYQFKVLNGEVIEEIIADRKYYELSNWFFGDNTANVVKFPYKVNQFTYLRANWKRKTFKIKIVHLNGENAQPKKIDATAGGYVSLNIPRNNENKKMFLKGIYYLEDENDQSTKKYIPPTLFYDFDKDITVYYEYEKRLINVKFILDSNPKDKDEKIKQGIDPYPSHTINLSAGDNLTKEEVEKIGEISDSQMALKANVMYEFKGWSRKPYIKQSDYSLENFPINNIIDSFTLYPVYTPKTYTIEYYENTATTVGKARLKRTTKNNLFDTNQILSYTQESTLSHYILGGEEQEKDPTKFPEEKPDKSNVVYNFYNYKVNSLDEIKTIRLYAVYKKQSSYIALKTGISDLNPRGYVYIATQYNELIPSQDVIIQKLKDYYQDQFENINPGYEIDFFSQYDPQHHNSLRQDFPININTKLFMYIHWKPRLYTLTYNHNYEKDGKQVRESYPVFNYQTVNKIIPERPGYRFIDWYSDKNLTKVAYENNYGGVKFKLVKDTEVYAKWELIQYDIVLEYYSLLNKPFDLKFNAEKSATLPKEIFKGEYNYEYTGLKDIHTGEIVARDKETGLGTEYTVSFEKYKQSVTFNVLYRDRLINLKINRIGGTVEEHQNINPYKIQNSNIKRDNLYKLSKDYETHILDELDDKRYITLKKGRFISITQLHKYFIKDKNIELDEVAAPDKYQYQFKLYKRYQNEQLNGYNSFYENVSGYYLIDTFDTYPFNRMYMKNEDNRRLYDIKSIKVKYEGDSDYTKTLTADEIKYFVYKTNVEDGNQGYLVQLDKKIKEIDVVFDYKTYKINYDLQGGQEQSSSPLPKSTKYVLEQTIGVPIKPNYVFSHWTLSVRNVSLNNNGKLLPKKYLKEDITFTANWKPVTFNITYYDGYNNNRQNGPRNYSGIQYKSIRKLYYPDRINDYHMFLGWELYDSETNTPLTKVYLKENPDVNVYDSLKNYKGQRFLTLDQEFVFNYNKDVKAYAVYKPKMHKIKFHLDDETSFKVLKDNTFKLFEEGKSFDESNYIQSGTILKSKDIILYEMKDSTNPLDKRFIEIIKSNYENIGFDARIERSRKLDENFESIYEGFEDFVVILDSSYRYNQKPNFDKPLISFNPSFENHTYNNNYNSNTFIKDFQNSLFVHAYPQLQYSSLNLYITNNSSDYKDFNNDNDGYGLYIKPYTFKEFKLPIPEKVGYKFLGYSLDSQNKDNLFTTYGQEQLNAFITRTNKDNKRQTIYPIWEKLSYDVIFKEFHSTNDDIIDSIKNIPIDQRTDIHDQLKTNNDLKEILKDEYYGIRQFTRWDKTKEFYIENYKYLTGEKITAKINYITNRHEIKFSTFKFDGDEIINSYNYLQDVNTNNNFQYFSYYDIFAIKNNPKYNNGIEMIIYPRSDETDYKPSGFVLVNQDKKPIDENGLVIGEKVLREHIKPNLFITPILMMKMYELKDNFRIGVILEKQSYKYFYHNLEDGTVKTINVGKNDTNINFTNEENPYYDFKYYYYFSANSGLSNTTQKNISKSNRNVHIYNQLIEKIFNISYINTSNSNVSLPNRYYPNQIVYIPNITKFGYTFEGWKMKLDNQYFQEEPIKDLKITPKYIYERYNKPISLHTLYLEPVFKEKLINVVFDYGYANKIETKQVRLRENINIPNKTQLGQNPGFNFVKWTENTLGDVNFTSYEVSKQYDLYFKAKWEQFKVKLNFLHKNEKIDQDFIRQYNHNNESFNILETVYKPIIDERDLHISSVYINTTQGKKEISFPYVILEEDLIKQNSKYILNIHIEKQPNYYDLLYDYQGGYEDPANPNPLAFKLQAEGDKLITIHKPLKFGSDFLGYTIDGLEPDPILDLKIDTTAHRKNLIIRANWKPKSQTVTFDQIYGVNERIKVVTVPYGYKVERPKDPNHFGYTFVHWYLDDMFVPFNFENTNIRKDITIKALYQRHIQVVSVDYEKDKPNTIILNFGDYIPNFSNLSYNKSVLEQLYDKIEIPVNVKPTLVEPVNNNKLEFTFDTKDIYDNMIITFKKDMPIYTFIDQQARATGLLSKEVKIVYYDKKFTSYTKAISFEVPKDNGSLKFDKNNQATFFISVKDYNATVVPKITGYDQNNYKLELVEHLKDLNQFEYKITRINKEENDLVLTVSIPELPDQSFTILQE